MPSRRRLPLLALAILSVGIASGAAARSPAERAVLQEVRLDATGPFRWELRLESSVDLDLVGIRGGEDELSVQLPRHEPGPALRDLAFAEGGVAAIRIREEATSRGPNVRLSVETRRPLAYSLRTEGPVARISLWPRESAAPEEELRRRVETLRTELTRVESSREELAERLVELSAEQRRIRQDLGLSEARRAALQPRLEAALDDARERLGSLAEELETTRESLTRARGRESALQEEVARLELRFSEAREEATAAIEDQRARIARLETENERLLDELARRDQELLELRTGVAAPESGDRRGAAAADEPEALAVPRIPRGEEAPGPDRREGEAAAPNPPGAAGRLEVTEVVEPAEEAAREPGEPSLYLVVVATEREEERAERAAEAVRREGYTGEVARSSDGYLLVLLDRLPYADAVRLRNEAIARGHAPADAYLLPSD